MPYPQTDKPHRRNRRRLGRGQHSSASPVHTLVTGHNSTATITFESPVVVRGLIDLAIKTVSPVAQTIQSPTSVAILYNGPINHLEYSLPGPPKNVTSMTGGQILGLTGRIANNVPITADNILVADGTGGMVGARGTLDAAGNLTLIAGSTLTLTNANIHLGTAATIFGSGMTLQADTIAGSTWQIQATGDVYGRLLHHDPLNFVGSTVAALPGGNEGDETYATDGCKVGEAPGTGTGVPVYFSAGAWRVFSTDQPVQS